MDNQKALEGLERGLNQGDIYIGETEPWNAMQEFLRLQEMF